MPEPVSAPPMSAPLSPPTLPAQPPLSVVLPLEQRAVVRPSLDDDVSILLVDDQPESLLAMSSLLSDVGARVIQARSGREALRNLLARDFALILLDVVMLGMDGFETAALIRERERSRNTPIIFLTAAHRSDLQIFRGYSLGAVDYILKPIVPEVLRAKVRVFVELASTRARLERLMRHLETRLQTSEEKYAVLMEHANDAILVLDRSGTVLEVNRQAERLVGAPRLEIIGIPIGGIFDFGEGRLPALPAEGSVRLDEIPVRQRSGSTPQQWVDLSAAGIQIDGGERVVLAIARDVSERKRAADAVRELNEELERRVNERTTELESSNRELEAFSYSVAHDLRAPLRSIIGYSQILEQEAATRLEGEERQHLASIVSATRRMSQLINDLLALSRVTRGEMARQAVNLSAIVSEIEGSLREADPQRRVSISIEPEVMADADPRLIRLALENLIGNSWKFTGKREQATIEFGVDRARRPRVYYVRDNGAGFDMKHASQLFEAFQRLHVDDFDGTGIGLAIVQRVMMRHGGRAWAESAPDQGATFYFTIPKSRSRETAAR